MDEILEILEKDARALLREIARMLKKDVSSVKKAIRKYEKDKVILKYKAVINKELIRDEESDVQGAD